MGVLDFLSKTLGIDPGSENLRIVKDGKIIFNETAELSIDPNTNKVTGYGNDTLHDEFNKVLKPVYNVIADFHP